MFKRISAGILPSSAAVFLLAASTFAADLERAAPEQAGLSSHRLARVGEAIDSYIEAGRLAGAVVGVASENKIVYLETFGELNPGEPMREDAIFRIASMTKPVTSTAIMMLYEEGKLLLTDPVSKFIPEFAEPQVLVLNDPADPSAGYTTEPARREITILDLLTHMAGITYRFWGMEPITTIYAEAGIYNGLAPTPGTIGEMVKKLGKLPLIHHPGEAYAYGLNTDVLGHVVEVASGMPLDQFFQERIFAPLGMTDTQFFISDAQRARVSSLYIPGEDGSLTPASDETITWGPFVFGAALPYSDQRTFFAGGGGLSSTAADYLRFMQMFLNGGTLDGARILSPKSVELMSSNHIGELSVWDVYSPLAVGNLGDKFGLGFGIKSEAGQNELGSVGEYMWAGIFNTRFWIDPVENMSIVMLRQLGVRTPEIETKVHAAIYQAVTD
ncbi:MAG: serine hydrolase domain-containing protein [Alphaproteobacteria bacterium]|jgi:CubicO group peptidase (beta-lactamase class C family)|nr:serine hydrolase domain-containing protein [Alphaproteobacteria bacterium]